jgi:hypothetical protein
MHNEKLRLMVYSVFENKFFTRVSVDLFVQIPDGDVI